MSAWDSIIESEQRWLILAGIVFTAALVSTIFMLAFGWSHTLERVWLWLGLAATVLFLILFGVDWARRTEAAAEAEAARKRREEAERVDQAEGA